MGFRGGLAVHDFESAGILKYNLYDYLFKVDPGIKLLNSLQVKVITWRKCYKTRMAVVIFFVEQLASLNIGSVMLDFYSGNIIHACQQKKQQGFSPPDRAP